jgi:predicted AAA+ superfamily ATPase
LVILDEIQKVPSLLDEVQRLIVDEKIRFGLCGSSARKLRRGHANLLGGRALRYEMLGLTSHELDTNFDLQRLVNRGNLPLHYFSDEFLDLQRSYVADYLKEEIAAESLVRNLPSFSQFLDLSALSDCELVSYSTFARDVGVAVNTIREYFQILVDTLLCRFVPAYTKKAKRRTTNAPKFYFDNVGIVNCLAKRRQLMPGSEGFGKALENVICHELHAHSSYSGAHFDISYWRLTTGVEVDFILGDMQVAIECKASSKTHGDHLKNLRQLTTDFPKVKRKIVVSLESSSRTTDDDIEILPVAEFLDRLWKGDFV